METRLCKAIGLFRRQIQYRYQAPDIYYHPGTSILKTHCPICDHEPSANAIAFGEIKVCPRCMSEYVQRLKEGVVEA